MKATRIVGLACALCLGLILGLVFGNVVFAPAILLIGGGGVLILVVCGWAEWQ